MLEKIKYWLRPKLPKHIKEVLEEKLIPKDFTKISYDTFICTLDSKYPISTADILHGIDTFELYIVVDVADVYKIRIFNGNGLTEIPKLLMRYPSNGVINKYRF
jgi:hypothetical protein